MRLRPAKKPAEAPTPDPLALEFACQVPPDLLGQPLVDVVEKPFAREVLNRLPLAEAFYILWAHLAPDPVLAPLFAEFRGRCYQDKLAFAEVVRLLADAITRYHGSGHRAIKKALQRQQLSAKARAVYAKLGRLPLPLAEAFLSRLTARLRPLFPVGLVRSELPPSVAGLTVTVLDGKTLKKAAKRLLATRGRPGKLYGGKLLVAYLPRDGLAVAFAADPDGEANDIRLVPRVLPLVRAAVAGPRLFVCDSQFCDLDQAARFTEDDDHYLLRFTLRNSFTADAARPARSGVTANGQAFTEEWGWMGSEKDKRRCYVRRLTLVRPGEVAVILVTDLLDEQAYPGVELLVVYLGRWQIENVFQEITEVFALDHLIGCTPQATVFQAALCLVIYNVLQLVRSYAAASQDGALRVGELSAEKIFADMHEELISLHRTLQVDELLPLLRQPLSTEDLCLRLAALLEQAWSVDWKKAVAKKPRPHKPKAKQSGAHTSVHKILQQAKEKPAKRPQVPRQTG